MQTIYRPGDWQLIALSGAMVAVPGEAPAELVTGLWERLLDARSLTTVIDALTAHADGSFAAMLPFVAVVVEDGAARVAVRGSAAATVTGADAVAEVISGENVTTWNERFIAGATQVELALGAERGGELPLEAGIVFASAARAALDSNPSAGSGLQGEAAGPSVSPWVAEPVEAPSPSTSSGTQDGSEGSGTQDGVEGSGTQDGAEGSGTEGEAEGSGTEGEAEGASTNSGTQDGVEAPEIPVNGVTLLPTEVTYGTDSDEFEQLFGDTVYSPPAPASAVPTEPAPAELGDHDGATISAAELRALRGGASAASAAPEAPTEIIPVPSTGSIRMSTGQVVALDRTVIIGRRPRSTRASGANLPHLIAVESPQQDISRSHLEIRPEGDTVVVIDLHTTNGSTLLRPGADPLRLHPGEQTLVLSGDVVDLGDGVTVTFEGLL